MAVTATLAEVDDFRSAQDLYDLLRQRGEHVGLTTVYRTLNALAEAGEVDVIRRDDGEALFRRCSRAHHHHIVCRRCGRTVEVAAPLLESWAGQVARDHGYTDVTHSLEIVGLCRDCACAS